MGEGQITPSNYARYASQIYGPAVKWEGQQMVTYRAAPPDFMQRDTGGWRAIVIMQRCTTGKSTVLAGVGATPELALVDLLKQYSHLGYVGIAYCDQSDHEW